MKRSWLVAYGVLVSVLFSLHLAGAQTRQLLYPDSLSESLQEAVQQLQQTDRTSIPYADLNRNPAYFVRIAPRRVILTEDRAVQDRDILGAKPFVFITTPEGLYGKSLLQI